jgi:hypothetical protein
MNEIAAAREQQPLCHGMNFHDINFYSRMGKRSQSVEMLELIAWEFEGDASSRPIYERVS